MTAANSSKLIGFVQDNLRFSRLKVGTEVRKGISDMIRCIRTWTASDGDSHFEEGAIELRGGDRGDTLSQVVGAVALLGASPGASTAAFIAIGVLEKCFADRLTNAAWLPKLKQIIPSYGVSLIEDAGLLRQLRAETAAVLKVPAMGGGAADGSRL